MVCRLHELRFQGWDMHFVSKMLSAQFSVTVSVTDARSMARIPLTISLLNQSAIAQAEASEPIVAPSNDNLHDNLQLDEIEVAHAHSDSELEHTEDSAVEDYVSDHEGVEHEVERPIAPTPNRRRRVADDFYMFTPSPAKNIREIMFLFSPSPSKPKIETSFYLELDAEDEELYDYDNVVEDSTMVRSIADMPSPGKDIIKDWVNDVYDETHEDDHESEAHWNPAPTVEATLVADAVPVAQIPGLFLPIAQSVTLPAVNLEPLLAEAARILGSNKSESAHATIPGEWVDDDGKKDGSLADAMAAAIEPSFELESVLFLGGLAIVGCLGVFGWL